MRPLGHILLWIGFLVAAYASVSQLEVADDKWSTISWVMYAVAMMVGIAGVGLLRRARSEDHADDVKTEAEYSVVQTSLAKLTSTVGSLCDQQDHVPSEVLHCIDEECAEPFSEFADSRQALIKRFGMKVYADVMTEFASAERYVNRSWSAAADGYVDEVATSLRRANQHLQNAESLLQAAEANA